MAPAEIAADYGSSQKNGNILELSDKGKTVFS
jgi:hypothetical protein